jgi:hypothetical protein
VPLQLVRGRVCTAFPDRVWEGLPRALASRDRPFPSWGSWPNQALEPTPNSFRSRVAPAIGRGSPAAFGVLKLLEDTIVERSGRSERAGRSSASYGPEEQKNERGKVNPSCISKGFVVAVATVL